MEKITRNLIGSKLEKRHGITLIALMITIIVLLILAGVTLSLTLGERGIFRVAKDASKNYLNAQEEEQKGLNEFDKEVDKIIGNIGNGGGNNPPENGLGVASGTQVKKPSDKNWDEEKINSYADGEGNTIPVPKGFTPIPVEEGQGTRDTGFVIKDTSANADGTPSQTNGNEFVWVPVEGKSYTYNRYAMLASQPADTTDPSKIKYSTSSSYYFTEEMPEDEQESVNQYGGYYIGRYESGIEGGTLTATSNSSITNVTEKQNWTGYRGGRLVVKKDNKYGII